MSELKLTDEQLKSMPVGFNLPEPYNFFVDENGYVAWEALEMTHPGKTRVILDSLVEALSEIKSNIRQKEMFDYSTGVNGYTILGALSGIGHLPHGARQGDAYLINGDLWIFSGSTWRMIGYQSQTSYPGSIVIQNHAHTGPITSVHIPVGTTKIGP